MKKKLTIPIVDKNVEQPECSFTAGGCVNWYKLLFVERLLFGNSN